MGRSYKVEAVVLKRINLGEADRLITVFSKQQGKLKLMAKGIRRLSSRKKGHLELFNQVKLQIANGKNLDLVTEAETLNNFPHLRRNLNRVRIAYLLLELVDKLTAENQEHQEVYALLCDTLAQLNSDSASNNLIVDFETSLLQRLGFGLPAEALAKVSLPSRASLEAFILEITERPLHSKKLK